jgi:hypothetical protein
MKLLACDIQGLGRPKGLEIPEWFWNKKNPRGFPQFVNRTACVFPFYGSHECTRTSVISDYILVLYEFDDSETIYKELKCYAIENYVFLERCLKCLQKYEETVYYNALLKL